MSRVVWELGQPLSRAGVSVPGEDELRSLYPEAASEKLKYFRSGDKVAVLYVEGKVVYAERILGQGTVGNALKALEVGLERVVPNEDFELRKQIYVRISGFLHRHDRQRLVRAYEAHRLRFVDLLGDHTGLVGPLQRQEGGIYGYGLDS